MAEDIKTSSTPIYVCDDDLTEGEMRGLKVEEQWLLVVKFQNNILLLDAACAHSGYPLHKGTLNQDGVITCSLHYAQFDCKTGDVVSKPAICEEQIIFKPLVKDKKIYWLKESD